jgi:hypothetical protein
VPGGCGDAVDGVGAEGDPDRGLVAVRVVADLQPEGVVEPALEFLGHLVQAGPESGQPVEQFDVMIAAGRVGLQPPELVAPGAALVLQFGVPLTQPVHETTCGVLVVVEFGVFDLGSGMRCWRQVMSLSCSAHASRRAANSSSARRSVMGKSPASSARR